MRPYLLCLVVAPVLWGCGPGLPASAGADDNGGTAPTSEAGGDTQGPTAGPSTTGAATSGDAEPPDYPGFVIEGEPRSFVGDRIDVVGDLNGDGFDDLIVGSYHLSRAYVVFGKDDSEPVYLADVAAGVGGYVLQGPEDSDAGFSVSSGGDVNGDGMPDLVIGAIGVDSPGPPVVHDTGMAYVVFGSPGAGPIDLEDVGQGVDGFVVRATDSYECRNLGADSAILGDMNGDGLAEIAVAAPVVRDWGVGPCFVVFGKRDQTPVIDLDVAMGIGGFMIDNADPRPEGILSCEAVAAAGDANGDGVPDIVVAGGDDVTAPGSAFVVFGKADTDTLVLGELVERGQGIEFAGNESRSVVGVGDVNGDGLADVATGIPWGDGSVHVFYGRTDAALLDWAPSTGGEGFSIWGSEDVSIGASIAAPGDLDRDGVPDVFVGAGGSVYGDEGPGSVYLVSGADGLDADVQLADVGMDLGGYVLVGRQDGDRFGAGVVGGHDINGDGVPDVIVGAPGTHTNPAQDDNAGRIYVIFGE